MADEAFESFLEANREAQLAMGAAAGDDLYAGSPFEWIRKIASSRRRGKAGEVLAAAWLGRLGFDVGPPVSSGHDRLVNSRKVEIKFSTLWNGSNYVFQQLRDQDYELVVLMGLSPTTAHAWIVPKADAIANSVPQHGGAAGTDTRWIAFPADTPPGWLRQFGGEISAAEAVARRVF
ncbi:MAG: hypothetical protein ACREA0_22685 [bacterium]